MHLSIRDLEDRRRPPLPVRALLALLDLLRGRAPGQERGAVPSFVRRARLPLARRRASVARTRDDLTRSRRGTGATRRARTLPSPGQAQTRRAPSLGACPAPRARQAASEMGFSRHLATFQGTSDGFAVRTQSTCSSRQANATRARLSKRRPVSSSCKRTSLRRAVRSRVARCAWSAGDGAAASKVRQCVAHIRLE